MSFLQSRSAVLTFYLPRAWQFAHEFIAVLTHVHVSAPFITVFSRISLFFYLFVPVGPYRSAAPHNPSGEPQMTSLITPITLNYKSSNFVVSIEDCYATSRTCIDVKWNILYFNCFLHLLFFVKEWYLETLKFERTVVFLKLTRLSVLAYLIVLISFCFHLQFLQEPSPAASRSASRASTPPCKNVVKLSDGVT